MKYVLIIDDSPLIRVMVRRALKQAGVPERNMLECANGQEALERCRRGDVAVAVLDLNMPVLDGEGFLRALRAQRPDLDPVVIVVSTEANQRRILALRGLGIRGFLRKPFEPEKLRALLAEHVGPEEWSEEPTKEPSPLSQLPASQLDACLVRTLEAMAFLSTEPSERRVPDGSLSRAIELHGERWRGRLVVSATEEMAREAAAGMTGAEASELSELNLNQVLDELANVIGGELIVLLGGDQDPIRLGLPGPTEASAPIPATLTRAVDSLGELLQVDVGVLVQSAAPGSPDADQTGGRIQ